VDYIVIYYVWNLFTILLNRKYLIDAFMKFYFSFFILAFCLSAKTQTIHITGFVQDDKGNSISNALIQIKKSKTGIYSDSAGHFAIDVPLNSVIVASHANYKNTELPTAKKTFDNVVLTLEKDPKANNAEYNKDVDQYNARVYQSAITNPGSNVYGMKMTGLIPSFTHKENTRGSQYLFENWLNGAVLDSNGNMLGLNYKLNYDKVNGTLLATTDYQSALQVDRSLYKSFILFSDSGDTLHYDLVQEMDPSHYALLLGGNTDFKVYKLTATKFNKANYHTDGMVSSGNPYDEYEDETKYYVCNIKTNSCQSFSLRKKSILSAFNNDARVNEYFSKNKELIDETFIRNLVLYISVPADN